MSQRFKRDAGVELVRLIACVIVVAVHIILPDTVNGVYSASRGYIACLVADGVAVFWMVTGFFVFKNDNWSKLLRQTAFRVVIPAMAVALAVINFLPFLSRQAALKESLSLDIDTYISFFKSLLSLNISNGALSHLWYCYVYFLIILIFPVLSAFSKYLSENPVREKVFMAVSFGAVVINDITANATFGFSHHSINGLVPAAVLVVWGSIIYRYKDRLVAEKNKTKFLISGLVTYLLLNLLRTIIIQKTNLKTPLLFWYSGIGIMCAVSLVVFVLVSSRKIKQGSKMYKPIVFLSSFTFNIYLLHYPIINIFSNRGIQTAIYNFLYSKLSFSENIFEIAYTATTCLLVFGFTLLICVCLRLVFTLFKKLLAICLKTST